MNIVFFTQKHSINFTLVGMQFFSEKIINFDFTSSAPLGLAAQSFLGITCARLSAWHTLHDPVPSQVSKFDERR